MRALMLALKINADSHKLFLSYCLMYERRCNTPWLGKSGHWLYMGRVFFWQVSARKRTFVDLHTDDRCDTGRDTVAR